MRMFRRLTALCMVLAILFTSAQAEVPFLRHTKDWTLEQTPVEVLLSADITAHMPYDDDRMAMLKELTDNLSLRLTAGPDEGSVSVLVGNSAVLTLAYLDNMVQLSTIPDTAFIAEGDPVSALFGTPLTELDLYGLDAQAESLIDDGWILLNAISPALDEYADRRTVKTDIADMGTARSCTDYTVPKGDADSLKEKLLSLCPAGDLHTIIAGLTFSGKQTLRVYRTEDETPLRMEYNGTCGPEGNLRTVKLVWRMRRDDVELRDEISLTSPAKSGSNKNTLDFTRIITEDEQGHVSMEGEFSYTMTKDKQTTSWEAEFDLTNAYTGSADVISGSFTVQQKLPGEDQFDSLTFEPTLTLSGTQDDPIISGTVVVTGKTGKKITEHAGVNISLHRAENSAWTASEATIDLSALTDSELAQLREQVSASVASAVVRPLIILLGSEADWFFRDMPPEDVQEIVDAAGTVLVIE